jgi:hypothetical protein
MAILIFLIFFKWEVYTHKRSECCNLHINHRLCKIQFSLTFTDSHKMSKTDFFFQLTDLIRFDTPATREIFLNHYPDLC